jgi:phosphoadenosine phosphosulfate reductase
VSASLENFAGYEARLEAQSLTDRLRRVRDLVRGRLLLTSSFGIEDQLLTHAAAEAGCELEIVTLDTGRLFPETYEVWSETERRYGMRIRAFTPDPRDLEPLVARMGINGFRESVENRKSCCNVRKVQPLRRALHGAAGWISGLRASQSKARIEVRFLAQDYEYGLLRINPLFDWTREQVAKAVREQGVPYNRLEDEGVLSIGCQPCTRAVLPGEDERAGRWWWEHGSDRECGLHVAPDGRLVRSRSGEGIHHEPSR